MASKSRLYSGVLVLCAVAVMLGLWNGVSRGHWESAGLAAVVVVAANMAILLRKERRKPLA